MSSIDSIKSALGYPNNAGPIRQALNGSQPLQSALDSARSTLQQDFSNVLATATGSTQSWIQENRDAGTLASALRDRQNLPAGDDLASAIIDQVKSQFSQQQPLRTALDGILTPEMKTAAADEFHARAADWQESAIDAVGSRFENMRAAAISEFQSNVADWKATSSFSQKA